MDTTVKPGQWIEIPAGPTSRRVVDYSIIESDDHGELVEAVCSALADGWSPCGGGVCVWFEPARIVATNGIDFALTAGGIVHYVQAMVKYG